MSQPSERLRRLGRHIASIVTGLAAGPRNFTPRFEHAREAPVGKGEDETEGPRRRTEAAPGREGDEPPRRPADAAPREAATGEAEQAREEAAGRPAAGTPEGATPAAAAATEAAARSEQGSGERANPAAPQDLPEGRSPADVRRGIARESRRTGDSQGVAEPPSRVASPGHGQVGDLRNRVDQVVNDQARIAQQLVQLGDQARAAWRAAQEVARQLQQVNRNALKR
jgi:hypothetical protein